MYTVFTLPIVEVMVVVVVVVVVVTVVVVVDIAVVDTLSHSGVLDSDPEVWHFILVYLLTHFSS